MSEGRNISNNEQQKAYDENVHGILVKQRKKQHSQFESSKEWRELGERARSLKVLYMNLQKLVLNWREFEEPKEGLNMKYSMDWLMTKPSRCF